MMKKYSLSLAAFFISLFAGAAHAGIWDFFIDEGADLVVTDPFVEMRTGPGRGYPVFHVVEKGQSLHLFKRRTDWFKAKTKDGIVGWVKRTDLAKTMGTNGEEVGFAAPDWESYLDRRWELGVLGGRLEDADALTTYLGFSLTQNISAELKFTQSFSSVANNKLGSINLVHKPFPKWKVSPFFTIGTGEIQISPNTNLVQTEERENPVLSVGGGTFLYMSRRFLLRLEYNNHTLLTDRDANEEVEEWKAGFSIFF